MSRRNSVPRSLSVGIVSASATRRAGGIFPIMQAHAKQLSALGFNVEMHCAEDEMTEQDAPSWAPVHVRSYPLAQKSFKFALGMKASLLAGDYDILHQHGLWQYPSIAVSHWQRRTGRPVVISTQGMLEPWALANAKVKKSVATWLFERANLTRAACIQCSPSEVAGVRSFGLKNPIAVLVNGANIPDLNARPARPSWLPNDGRRTLLFLGRLHPKKGIRETLDAWSIITTRHGEIADRWRLVIVGWGDVDHVDAILAHARTLGLTDVLFPGPAYGADAQGAYAHADAFILASHSEGLPMAVLEAWSYGVPVLMTRECNLSHGFIAGAAIEITTNPADISRVLVKSLADPDLSALGRRGRELVRSQFGWPLIGQQLGAVYQWLAQQGPRPDCVSSD